MKIWSFFWNICKYILGNTDTYLRAQKCFYFGPSNTNSVQKSPMSKNHNLVLKYYKYGLKIMKKFVTKLEESRSKNNTILVQEYKLGPFRWQWLQNDQCWVVGNTALPRKSEQHNEPQSGRPKVKSRFNFINVLRAAFVPTVLRQ